MPPINNFDEIIENEVCSRLIRLSCAKMVNLKSERGGAKLHRNLLILHLLKKARDEQKRFPVFTNRTEWVEESNSGDIMLLRETNSTTAVPACIASKYDEEDELFGGGEEVTHLLDLSKSCETIQFNDDGDSLTNHEHTEFDCSTLRIAPLQYMFTGPEMYDIDEASSSQQHLYSESSAFSDLYFSEQMISLPTKQCEKGELTREEIEIGKSSALLAEGSRCDSRYDCPLNFTDVADLSVAESTAGDGSVSSAFKSVGNELEMKLTVSGKDLTPSDDSFRHRKRKTSTHCLLSPCNAKKSCVEGHQLSGLISVFNSGLTVVADQFLARPTASTVSTFQQTPKHINTFMHFAYNPLIC